MPKPRVKQSLSLAAILAICCIVNCLSAQSPKDGSFTGNTYTDRYLGIVIALPENLRPKNQSETKITAPSSSEAWMMFVAQEEAEPYGIVMITQLLQPNRIPSAADFLRRVRNSREPGDKVESPAHSVSSHGLTFDWMDWRAANGEYDSAVVTQRGRYLLVARCNAKSEGDLRSMKNALFGMRVQKVTMNR